MDNTLVRIKHVHNPQPENEGTAMSQKEKSKNEDKSKIAHQIGLLHSIMFSGYNNSIELCVDEDRTFLKNFEGMEKKQINTEIHNLAKKLEVR